MGELALITPGFPKSLIHPAAQNGVFRENANSPSWKLIPPKIIEISIQILKIFRLRRARFSTFFLLDFFEIALVFCWTLLRNVLKSSPPQAKNFPIFLLVFFEIALVICWMLLKNVLKLSPPQAKIFPIFLLVFFEIALVICWMLLKKCAQIEPAAGGKFWEFEGWFSWFWGELSRVFWKNANSPTQS